MKIGALTLLATLFLAADPVAAGPVGRQMRSADEEPEIIDGKWAPPEIRELEGQDDAPEDVEGKWPPPEGRQLRSKAADAMEQWGAGDSWTTLQEKKRLLADYGREEAAVMLADGANRRRQLAADGRRLKELMADDADRRRQLTADGADGRRPRDLMADDADRRRELTADGRRPRDLMADGRRRGTEKLEHPEAL
ncbi:hypothetical protein BBJ28_00022186 [Nothophytophthora sp. Chile5]|nr:hypothetical protein BBJ28_00022186 [Nothophytophthora sp. Chile5]